MLSATKLFPQEANVERQSNYLLHHTVWKMQDPLAILTPIAWPTDGGGDRERDEFNDPGMQRTGKQRLLYSVSDFSPYPLIYPSTTPVKICNHL